MFAEKLKELRIARGLSQAELARHISSTQRQISNWENSVIEPSIAYLILVSNFFECSIDYLVGRENDIGLVEVNNDLKQDEKNLLSSYQQMDEAEKTILTEYTEILLRNHKKITIKSIK